MPQTVHELLTATIIFSTILVLGGLALTNITDDPAKAYMISFTVATLLGGAIFIKIHEIKSTTTP
ncbi:MAG: hypothetical protein JW778_03255 [Candidatus Altiarchaeota archaeon]|nr:hypothetical protein [Candidatus Altiarchaeota archaeon]